MATITREVEWNTDFTDTEINAAYLVAWHRDPKPEGFFQLVGHGVVEAWKDNHGVWCRDNKYSDEGFTPLPDSWVLDAWTDPLENPLRVIPIKVGKELFADAPADAPVVIYAPEKPELADGVVTKMLLDAYPWLALEDFERYLEENLYALMAGKTVPITDPDYQSEG